MGTERTQIDDAGVRLAYRELLATADPARAWLAAGAVDGRFGGDHVPAGAVVRGPADLVEIHDVVDDLFGVGCFARPPEAISDVVRMELTIARPAVIMPFIESLRPHLEGRGPAFWTWKTAREAMAARLQSLDVVTVEATRR